MQTERNYFKCSNHEFLLEQLKNYQGGKNLTQRLFIISRKRTLNQLENCQKSAHNFSWNTCMWPELVDMTFFGQRTNLLDQKWTGACDKLLARLISYIHHTSDFRHCRRVSIVDWVYSKTQIFAGDLEDSNSTSGGIICILGSRTFVPISWMCKKQMSVSHSSTESEIISLDAGLQMDWLITCSSFFGTWR